MRILYVCMLERIYVYTYVIWMYVCGASLVVASISKPDNSIYTTAAARRCRVLLKFARALSLSGRLRSSVPTCNARSHSISPWRSLIDNTRWQRQYVRCDTRRECHSRESSSEAHIILPSKSWELSRADIESLHIRCYIVSAVCCARPRRERREFSLSIRPIRACLRVFLPFATYISPDRRRLWLG